MVKGTFSKFEIILQAFSQLVLDHSSGGLSNPSEQSKAAGQHHRYHLEEAEGDNILRHPQITSGIQAEHRLAIGLVALGVTTFAVLLSLSRGGTMSLAAVGLVTTGMLLKTGRLTPKVARWFSGYVSYLLERLWLFMEWIELTQDLDSIWTELRQEFLVRNRRTLGLRAGEKYGKQQ